MIYFKDMAIYVHYNSFLTPAVIIQYANAVAAKGLLNASILANFPLFLPTTKQQPIGASK